MFLLSTTLFVNRGNIVGLYLLSALVDLSQVQLYDWGGVGLATLYGYMSLTSRRRGDRVGGYWRAWEVRFTWFTFSARHSCAFCFALSVHYILHCLHLCTALSALHILYPLYLYFLHTVLHILLSAFCICTFCTLYTHATYWTLSSYCCLFLAAMGICIFPDPCPRARGRDAFCCAILSLV